MRKISSILLVFCMVMSLCVAPAFADDVTKTFNALSDVTGNVQGINFYDNGMLNKDSNYKVEAFGEKLVLRSSGEWVTYDVSFDEIARPAGTYEVSMKYVSTLATSNHVFVDFIVDDNLYLKAALGGNASAWTDEAAESGAIGKIYLDEDASVLKVKNSGINHIFIETITLKYVGAEDTTDIITLYTENISNRINANNTASTVKLEEDYWDAAINDSGKNEVVASDGSIHYSTASSKVFDGSTLTQHSGDWAKYDISDFKPGKYAVSYNRANQYDSNAHLSIDGIEVINVKVAKTGSYSLYEEAELGELYIGENSKYLTLKTTGGAAYIKYLTFTYVENTPAYSIGTHNVIAGGQGVGYNDTSGNGKLESYNPGMIYLRPAGEWVAYDVSSFASGVYTLKINYSVRTTDYVGFIDVSLDNSIKKKAYLPRTTANLNSDHQELEIGNIEITPETKVLKLENTSRGVICISSITLWQTEQAADTNIRIHGGNLTLSNVNAAATATNEVDYYDTTSLNNNVQEDMAVHNPTEWTRYDVSKIAKGTYKVTVNYGTRAATQIGMSLDGENVINADMPNTNGLTVYGNCNVGYITFDGSQKYLIAKILSNNSLGAYYLKYIDLELISEEINYINYATNVIEGGHGVGFYDSKGDNKFETNGNRGGVVARAGDWYKYNLTYLPDGVYDIVISCATKANVTMKGYINDSETPDYTKATPNTKDYFKFTDCTIGRITAGEDAKTLKLEFTGNVYYNSISFVPVTDITKVTYTSDAEGLEKIDSILGLSTAYAKVEINRPFEESIGMKVYVAVYDGNSLKAIKCTDETITENNYTNIFEIPNLSYGNVVKTFIWEADTNIPVIKDTAIIAR